jgi:hypothetical protein
MGFEGYRRETKEAKMTNEPLCPIHQVGMLPATHWIKLDGKPFPKPVHVCPTTDCIQAHGPEGYHLIPTTEAIGNPIEEVLKRAK